MSHMTYGDEIHALRTTLARVEAERDALSAKLAWYRDEVEMAIGGMRGVDGWGVVADMLEDLERRDDTTSLARLKSEWQAEALEEAADGMAFDERTSWMLRRLADQKRRQPQEPQP